TGRNRHIGKAEGVNLPKDALGFADVTIATGLLQSLMHRLWDDSAHPPTHLTEGRRILMFPDPGADHLFGISMAALFFERGGWQVETLVRPTPRSVAEALTRQPAHAIGLSLTRREFVEPARQLLLAARNAAKPARPVVIGGGHVLGEAPDLAGTLGLDAVLVDLAAAPSLTAALVDERAEHA
ncbi:MAG: hypothetical protein AAFV96_05300, partial [Pseudomonadota bacterium]